MDACQNHHFLCVCVLACELAAPQTTILLFYHTTTKYHDGFDAAEAGCENTANSLVTQSSFLFIVGPCQDSTTQHTTCFRFPTKEFAKRKERLILQIRWC